MPRSSEEAPAGVFQNMAFSAAACVIAVALSCVPAGVAYAGAPDPGATGLSGDAPGRLEDAQLPASSKEEASADVADDAETGFDADSEGFEGRGVWEGIGAGMALANDEAVRRARTDASRAEAKRVSVAQAEAVPYSAGGSALAILSGSGMAATAACAARARRAAKRPVRRSVRKRIR